MKIFQIVRMENIPKVDKLIVSWGENIFNFFHKQCHKKNDHNVITLNTIISVLYILGRCHLRSIRYVGLVWSNLYLSGI